MVLPMGSQNRFTEHISWTTTGSSNEGESYIVFSFIPWSVLFWLSYFTQSSVLRFSTGEGETIVQLFFFHCAQPKTQSCLLFN